MKKGFTMIELIFVIVILGILAAVAIPRLAATRDDARLAAIKTDIGTFMNAIPAWYQGQRDARIEQAVSIDLAQWAKPNPGVESYTLSIDGAPCVTIAVWDMNGTAAQDSVATIGAGLDINTSNNGAWGGANPNSAPVFRVIQPGGMNGICATLWDVNNGLGVTEANISMAGRRVQW
ncbi:prepilin-type N-terminal cleavage/methylation domain-containing protein [Sulfurospirillum arcachonense]|uniref:prepilin-type N-terminal cleavage/methylation domain-containing protein n=1 Tax=Sulfurospirillum arcachonense TaxID=57666 RepID=UPI000469BDA6|nr:prepilin-type N-terminal cleavage/methylation domain-containing protein [Sulfurospirillum arcachonense]